MNDELQGGTKTIFSFQYSVNRHNFGHTGIQYRKFVTGECIAIDVFVTTLPCKILIIVIYV